MISPRLTNCKECANIPDLLRKIDCKLAELGNNLYNNVVFALNRDIAVSQISELLVYKRVLQHRFCDTHYAESCPNVSTEDIASKVIRLTVGCVPFCNEPTVCEITTCAITPCPNPTTTTTSTSSTSTTTTTSTSSTTTTTTTLNCNFSGVIDCNITTTTTTTPAPTTTTTTTYFPDPFGIPCLWSTNGGDPGLIGVYDFDTNTATDVLVPNDFNQTVGIERPICATEDKVWLASIVDQGSNLDNDNDDKVYIREWDIDATGTVPTLTYVREITVRTGQYSGANLGGSSVWAMTAIDNDTLIIGTGYELTTVLPGTGGTGSMYIHEFSIAAAGDITVNNNDLSSAWAASAGVNTSKISNLTYTNSGQLVLGYRTDLFPDGSGQSIYVGNYIRVFPVTPSNPEFLISNQAIQEQHLQNNGYPQFTNTYTGVKDAPFWGVNGLAQVLHPETLEVYTMDQSAPYNLTLTTQVISSNEWLSSATHCSNIEFVTSEVDPDCGLTWFPAFLDDDGIYLGQQTFQYQGMTCTASLSGNINAWSFQGASSGGFLGCSGLTRPSSEGQVVSRMVQGNNFGITITFPIAMNNLPIRAGVLNSNAEGTSGDVYYVETNGGTPTLSINQGCYVQVDGNRLFGGVPNPPLETAYGNEGDGEFLVTAPSNFTTMTITGNAPTGGPLFLGCATPPSNCVLVYSTDAAGSNNCNNPSNAGRCYPGVIAFKKYFAWDVNANTEQEILLPPGTATGSPNFGISENYLIVDKPLIGGIPKITRYGYTNVNGIPSNLTWNEEFIDYPNDDVRFYGAVMTAVNDNKFLGNWQQGANSPNAVSKILEWDLVGGVLSYNVKIDLSATTGYFASGDLLVLFNQDGTPSKIIIGAFIPPLDESGQASWILQFDYETNTLDGVVAVPSGIRTSAAIGFYDGGIYIGPSTISASQPDLTGVWRLDVETQEWTKLDNPPSNMGFPTNGPGDFASTPECRISDGLVFGGTTTTTTTDPNTTTTTTTAVPGVRTIFTKFNLFNQSV
tara:strand:+ start:4651 stop:7698 length:3048 start_codon:yes stop_codon:yes gene_type:complete